MKFMAICIQVQNYSRHLKHYQVYCSLKVAKII